MYSESIAKLRQAASQFVKALDEIQSTSQPEETTPQTIKWEHGKWYRGDSGHDWLIKFDRVEDKKVMVLDSFCISTDSNFGGGYHCDVNEIKPYSPATPEDMQLLPDGHPEKQWTPKKGDWAEVISVSDGDLRRGLNVGDIVQINENDTCPYVLKDGKAGPDNSRLYCIYANQLRHLPNYKPKPALAATYKEIAEAVKPLYWVGAKGTINAYKSPDQYLLPTESSAKQDRAYIQIKNLEAYCADRFEGDKDSTIDVDDAGNLVCYDSVYGSIKVSFKAGQWLIKTHPEPFLVFFGVKS